MKSLIVAPLLVAGVKVSPVGKVIQLLGELKTKVQNDLEADAKAMDEYSSYCDDESKEKGFAIKTAKSQIESFQATIEEAVGKIQQYSADIETDGATIAAKQSELAEATNVRENEHKDFVAAERELVDTVDTLARAASVLKRELSLAQGGSVSSKKLGDLVAALGAIVEASSNPSAKKVKAFLEEDNELSLHQPQAAVHNYESKSGGIVAAIEDMQGKAEETLQSTRRDETKKRHSFEMLKQSLEDAITNLTKEVEEANANKSTTEEAKAQAEEDLAKTQASKAADEKFLATLQRDCQNKASEWEARQASAADEMAALEKAKEILSSGVKALVQVAVTKTTVKSRSLDSRDELVSFLHKLGRKYNSFGLMQIASRAGSDPFVKIRGLIEDMIAKLVKQANEEATQEAFCQEETAKTKKARETKNASIDKYQARVDKATAGVAQLKQEVAALEAEIADIQNANKDATALRQKENAAYKKASKDYRESADAVTQAMEVLREFYGGASFVQQPNFGAARSDSGNSIISFLEVAQSDFTRLLAETESTEAEAVEAYKTMSQENAVSLATKKASVKGKNSEIKSLGVAISNISSDLGNANKELDAIMEYLDKLKPQCESKAMSYAERKARRDSEIAGLKQALDILEGDEPAMLLQKKAFLAKN